MSDQKVLSVGSASAISVADNKQEAYMICIHFFLAFMLFYLVVSSGRIIRLC